MPIVCGGLVKAVKRESNQAVAHHWGVSPQTVTKWRKAPGVPFYTEGTIRMARDSLPERLDDDARKRSGNEKQRTVA